MNPVSTRLSLGINAHLPCNAQADDSGCLALGDCPELLLHYFQLQPLCPARADWAEGGPLVGCMLQACSSCAEDVAARVKRLWPDLPCVALSALQDRSRLESFITQVLAYARWQQVRAEGLTRAALYGFHAQYKYQLLACSRSAYQQLGRLLGQPSTLSLSALAQRYFSQLIQALALPVSRGNHVNALLHMAGYFKQDLTIEEKAHWQQVLEQYLRTELPLSEPIALLQQYCVQHPKPYIAEQAYLQAHPALLAVRALN